MLASLSCAKGNDEDGRQIPRVNSVSNATALSATTSNELVVVEARRYSHVCKGWRECVKREEMVNRAMANGTADRRTSLLISRLTPRYSRAIANRLNRLYAILSTRYSDLARRGLLPGFLADLREATRCETNGDTNGKDVKLMPIGFGVKKYQISFLVTSLIPRWQKPWETGNLLFQMILCLFVGTRISCFSDFSWYTAIIVTLLLCLLNWCSNLVDELHNSRMRRFIIYLN